MPQSTPTLTDIAITAGVSAMTASRALNNKPGVSERTRAAILKVASDMGYVTNRVAQKLASGQSGVIGVVALQLDHPYIIGIVNSVVRAATSAGTEVLIYTHPEREKEPSGNVLQMLQQFTDGVVVLPPFQPGFLDELARGRFPVALVDSPLENSGLPSVAADDYAGARTAMSHLAELGHKRALTLENFDRDGRRC